LDPAIMKFTPICHARKFIFNSDTWQYMDLRVGDCPNVVYYKRNEHFKAKQYLWEDCLNWGNHKERGGSRSVMLVAIRLLFILGIRRVYLLGVDFTMDAKTTYHFKQSRARGSVSGNNDTYQKLNEWFQELRPLFEKEDYQIYNCNPHSRLTAFDHMPFAEACAQVREEFDKVEVDHERTEGLYSTSTEDKRAGKGK
jgi:isocitrate dehydrogenase kinase/phosphatase